MGQIINVSIRHATALVLFVISWWYLNHWYAFRISSDYLIFVLLFSSASLIGAWPSIRSILRVNPSRALMIGMTVIVFLPWGEWLQLNFPSSRADWSRQIYKQIVFLYGCGVLFQLFPRLESFFHAQFVKLIDLFASRKWIMAAIPVLFFLFTSYIALFVYRQTPFVQDSAAHLFQAKIFKSLHFSAPAPPVPEFFSVEGDMLVIHQNRWFFLYLPGYAMLLAAASLLRAEWLLSPLLGSLTIWIWMRYAGQYRSRQVAVLLGIFCLVSPFLFSMFSTVMIHAAELFFASLLFFLIRKFTERRSLATLFGIFLALFIGTLVRGFSLLPFLAPALLYLGWRLAAERDWLSALILGGAIAGAFFSIAFYQSKTTGDPFLPAYNLEYTHAHTYGFGPSFADQVHTPPRALEQLSNHLLGINMWLTGWYSGSLFFLILFGLLVRDFGLWDRLLFLGIVCTMLFYFFYVIQDLVFGPRFYFIVAPALLFFVARIPFGEVRGRGPLREVQKFATAVMFVSLLSFLPHRLYTFVVKYVPPGNQRQVLQAEIQKLQHEKTLLMIDPRAIQQLVALNDPFLRDPVLLLRDREQENEEAFRRFAEYQPRYFRLDVKLSEGMLKGGYGIFPNPNPRVPGHVSLFEAGMALETARYYPDIDIFDYAYSEIFNRREAKAQWDYLQTVTIQQPHRYKDHFRAGIIHAAKALLIPKVAFEQFGNRWKDAINTDEFLGELEHAENSFRLAGPIGQAILEQINKARIRIDKNRDQRLSREEISQFLKPKIKLLELQ